MAASQRQFCGKCGTAIADPADLFCTVCGTAFNAAPADDLIPEEPTQETVDEVNPENAEEDTERELTIEEAQSVTLLARIASYESLYNVNLVVPTEVIRGGSLTVDPPSGFTKEGALADRLLHEGALYEPASDEDWDWWLTILWERELSGSPGSVDEFGLKVANSSSQTLTFGSSRKTWTKAYPHKLAPKENMNPKLKTVPEVPIKPAVTKPKQTVISKPKQTVTQQQKQTSDLTINKLLLFSGSVSIGLYWGNIMLIVFLLVILFIGAATLFPTGNTGGIIWMVGLLLTAWPTWSIIVCRLRDAGKSPWLCLLALIPVGFIIIGMLPQSENNEA